LPPQRHVWALRWDFSQVRLRSIVQFFHVPYMTAKRQEGYIPEGYTESECIDRTVHW
jgi:hypothetical protein